MNFRVGSGFDVHAFGPGDGVMLGGVQVPWSRGVVAHSDGDVLLHALTDALLGAGGLGDIGQHFPDTDPHWRGAASTQFVAHAVQLLARAGWRVVNADLTLLAEAPRIAAYRAAICQSVARAARRAAGRRQSQGDDHREAGFHRPLGRPGRAGHGADRTRASAAPWRRIAACLRRSSTRMAPEPPSTSRALAKASTAPTRRR